MLIPQHLKSRYCRRSMSLDLDHPLKLLCRLFPSQVITILKVDFNAIHPCDDFHQFVIQAAIVSLLNPCGYHEWKAWLEVAASLFRRLPFLLQSCLGETIQRDPSVSRPVGLHKPPPYPRSSRRLHRNQKRMTMM